MSDDANGTPLEIGDRVRHIPRDLTGEIVKINDPLLHVQDKHGRKLFWLPKYVRKEDKA